MESIDGLLSEVLLGVGEELAMLLPMMAMEEPGEGVPPVVADAVRMRVSFQGAWFGEVVLGFGGTVPEALAANMLGAEDQPDPGMVRDACAEFANVVCGNLLPRLAGKGPIFTLGAPAAVESMAISEGYVPCGAARIDFDEGPVEVVLGLDEIGMNELGGVGTAPP